MDEEIMVSICCITYNHEKYIRNALDGFLKQKTNFRYEIIVHDDVSTDNTANIVKEYEKKYPGIFNNIYQTENQCSKGNSPTLTAMKSARGKYIALCEGDDYWIDENKLQMQFNYMEQNKDCSFCFHNAQIYDERTKMVIRNFVPYRNEQKKYLTKDNKYNTGELALLNEIPTASYFFRNNIVFPDWCHNLVAGDIVIQLLSTNKGFAYYMDEVMSVYRIGTGISAMDKWRADDKNKNVLKILNRLKGYIYIYENINKESNYEYDEVLKKIIKNFKVSIILLKDKKCFSNEDKMFIKQLDLKNKYKIYINKQFPNLYEKIKNIKEKRRRRMNMNNDKILVTQSSIPELDEYIKEIKSIFETKWLTNMGEKHKKLEQKLKEYLEIKNISLFTNGHTALTIGIQAMNFPKGGEVITTPYSFSSTTHAIVQNGLKPVFCDVKEDDYTIDVNKIEKLITSKTVAILPVHVYGHVCDVEKIEQIAKKYNLKVIYDAAHVFGVKYKGQSIANYGDISMFSFHATKVFNTIEGGALIYNNEDLKSYIDKLKNFGINGPERVEYVGTNAKMNEFCAAMGLCNLRHLDEEIQKREKVYKRYIQRLSNITGIKISKEQENVKPNYAYFPIVFEKENFGKTRDEVMEELAKENIFTRKYFYPLINDYECYRCEYDSAETPIAKTISDNVLTVPMYADLPLEDVDRICDIILQK